MTPMVDIVMCILIFFMLSMTFAKTELFLTSNTPQTKGPGTTQVQEIPRRLMVEMKQVLRDGARQTFVKPESQAEWLPADQARLIFAQLRAGGLSDDVMVILSPQSDVPYNDVINAYDACIEAKFRNVAFSPA
jgi:biopolymer transport protein ExbD